MLVWYIWLAIVALGFYRYWKYGDTDKGQLVIGLAFMGLPLVFMFAIWWGP